MSADDPVAAFEAAAFACHAPPMLHCCVRAGLATVIRDLAAVLVDDDRLEPTGHDDRCSYGPPGECDCCRGQHYRWLIARADELKREVDEPTAMIGTVTADDIRTVAFATGGRIHRAERIPEFAPEVDYPGETAAEVGHPAAPGPRWELHLGDRWIDVTGHVRQVDHADVAAEPQDTAESADDAARRFAGELQRLVTGLADLGITGPHYRPRDSRPVTVALDAIDRYRTGLRSAAAHRDQLRADLAARPTSVQQRAAEAGIAAAWPDLAADPVHVEQLAATALNPAWNPEPWDAWYRPAPAPEPPGEPVVITREELTGHIDDPVCACFRCRPEWHTGVRCNCPHCKSIRGEPPATPRPTQTASDQHGETR